ncbi:MAG: hypothetical protein WED33_06420 [Bacteroidia bacterium]
MEGNEDYNQDDWQTADLLKEVDEILSFSGRREAEVLDSFGKGSYIATGVNAKYCETSSRNFLKEEDIKQLCIRYRLRFLPVQLYCGEVPYEVISKIKAYEHRNLGKKTELYILAPSNFFLLKNEYNDPLLFAVNQNDTFELLCSWGDKSPWYVPVLKYPYRDFKSMVISSLIVGFIIALICGLNGVLNYPNMFKSIIMKVPIMILSAGLFSTITLCYGLITKTDFSADNWRSKYFSKRII